MFCVHAQTCIEGVVNGLVNINGDNMLATSSVFGAL